MPIDPDDPPIWLRKLHMSAAQISPTDYPAPPEEGILTVCRLSDEVLALSKAFQRALESRTQSTSEKPLISVFEPEDVTQE